MQVPKEVKDCIGFIGLLTRDGIRELRGTCFFVTRPLCEAGGTEHVMTYVVTARHVITKIENLLIDNISIRVNFHEGGAGWIDNIPITKWKFHPSENAVDVAVCNIFEPPSRSLAKIAVAKLDIKFFPLSGIANKSVLKNHAIDVGDEVFFPGLFTHHRGQQKNIPIIRVGNIAAMPDEKVSTEMGLMDAYLVEARSIGGLSGSPVFVHLGLTRNVGGKVVTYLDEHISYFLLGLVSAHFDIKSDKKDENYNNSVSEEKINMGIAVVTPISKIMEVINQTHFVRLEAKLAKDLQEEYLPTMD